MHTNAYVQRLSLVHETTLALWCKIRQIGCYKSAAILEKIHGSPSATNFDLYISHFSLYTEFQFVSTNLLAVIVCKQKKSTETEIAAIFIGPLKCGNILP